MKKVKVGDCLQIQCYKHNKKTHRSWDEAIVLDVQEDYIVCGDNKALVIESDGSYWKTKEPAILYFFKDRWYNIIVQLKKNGIQYYCNIASPYIIEDDTIKYIDYDLDLRVFPNGSYKILDRMEYQYHKKIMYYSKELDLVINGALDELIQEYRNHFFAFSKTRNLKYYNQYVEQVKQIQKSN